MKTRSRLTIAALMIGLCAACGLAQAQRIEVEVKFVQMRAQGEPRRDIADWSELGSRRGVDVLATPRMIMRNGERGFVRVESQPDGAPGVRASVTPLLTRRGTRLTGQASIVFRSARRWDRSAQPPADTVTAEFNRTVRPGQSAVVYLGRRWEEQTVEDRRPRFFRSLHRERVPFDYYVSFTPQRVVSRY